MYTISILDDAMNPQNRFTVYDHHGHRVFNSASWRENVGFIRSAGLTGFLVTSARGSGIVYCSFNPALTGEG